MKNKYLIALFVTGLLLSGQNFFAAETNDTTIADLNNLVLKINAKLMAGKTRETDLADNLKEFDALLVKHKGDKPEELAHILMMKAGLYLEVLNDPEKAANVFQQIKHDLPTTEIGKRVDMILDSLKRPIEAQKIRRGLVEGIKFPKFGEKDMAGKPLSIANYKGKVVLVDFWATWCVPCVAEMPNVIQTYQKYHAQGFEIIGISLDQDQQTFERFIKEKSMTWQEFFDGQGFDNKLAMKYGIMSIPATFLLDGNGIIIAKDLRGKELEQAVAKALAKN
jgi:thiol-disulfide isomerase/thioredoxin